MRERRPDDWRRDLGNRHPLEGELARALAGHHRLILLTASTGSRLRLDYQLVGPGDRLIELELKEKRQPYVGWSSLRPQSQPENVFILDELALRHILDAGRYGFLLVRDVPSDRWSLWSTGDLVLASKVLTTRRLAGPHSCLKGKILVDLTESGAVCASLPQALDTLADLVVEIDARWDDIAPWNDYDKGHRSA